MPQLTQCSGSRLALASVLRWMPLVVGCGYQILAGSMYAFSSISSDLQAHGHKDVAILGAAGGWPCTCHD
jgi:hypothetical protein